MDLFLIAALFVGATVLFAMSIWNYNRKDSTESARLNQRLDSFESQYKQLENLVGQNVSTVVQCKMRLEKFDQDVELVREQMGDTREKQIQLREVLANKRPVLKMPQGPIQVELYAGNPKAATPTKLMKKIKGQLGEVSK